MRVAEALALARTLGVERLDAQLLVAHAAGRDRTWVLVHGDAMVDGDRLRGWLARRADGEPLSYLTGRREFHGLLLDITPDVLDPRPDTETLVDWAIELLAPRGAAAALDLGTGSGAVALAIKRACPAVSMHATDASAAALAVARRNGQSLGLAIEWQTGSWWDAPLAGAFDLVVSNPPYVAPGDPHLPSLRHEPLSALVPGGDPGDGLADLRRIVAGAPTRLRPGGWLLLEHGADQGAAVRAMLEAAGFADVTTRPDLAGRPRASGGRQPC